MGSSFTAFVQQVTGHAPYRYQERIAARGLPEVLPMETGTGKTAAVILGWLWRRRHHPEPAVRSSTPHWLVLCEPMRTLTEQAEASVKGWLERAGLEKEVLVHVALGGRERPDDEWRRHPESDAIVIGTLDMLLSRALNRGYGNGRFTWPIDFGLLHSGCHWVFDETQLMGPALATSRQLDALRRSLGTAAPTSSTWMSATVDLAALRTFDAPIEDLDVFALTDYEDLDPALAGRRGAGKVVRRLDVDPTSKRRAEEIAVAVAARHRPGTRSLVVCNTVAKATAVAEALGTRSGPAPVVLVHRRFRPPERADHFRAAAKEEIDPEGPGVIVVATQVIEAGVDISAHTLFTEAAPWPSIVQRAGRCNRDGRADHAGLWWIPPEPKPVGPYEPADVEAATEALHHLEGVTVTPTSLAQICSATSRPPWTVLRRSDLLGLFDTTADLSGNDIDIAPFLRDGDDLDVLVAWRALGGQRPDPRFQPLGVELCPVPLGKDLRTWIDRDHDAHPTWRFDHLERGWVRAGRQDLRPGLVLVADAERGGYDLDRGWDPKATVPVPEVATSVTDTGLMAGEERIGDDPLTHDSRWITLERHLADVEREVGRLLDSLAPPGLSDDQRFAAAAAGRLHDIGKVHPVFQGTMAACFDEDHDEGWVIAGAPWAKSGGSKRPRHQRRNFRHELASALALLGDGAIALQGVREPDLVVYLVAAHHGRVRTGIRSAPREHLGRSVLGVEDGDLLPAVTVPGGEVPPTILSLEPMRLGRSADGSPSWSERALALVDRDDLGPFRLAYLEAVVRLADWRASAAEAAP